MYGYKLKEASAGALQFATAAIDSGYQVGLISFSSEAAILSVPTTIVEKLKQCLSLLQASGKTNLSSAISLATESLLPVSGPRTIVVVTDGEPDSQASAIDAAKAASARGIQIMAIGTADADQEFLSKIATARDLAQHVPPAQLRYAIASAAKQLPRPIGK